MKLILELAVVLMLASRIAVPQATAPNPQPSQKQIIPDDIAIRQIPEEWVRLYNNGNASAVAELYTEDGYYLSAHILANGRQAIQSYWERGIRAGGHIDFIRPLTVYHSGDLAYCAGIYEATNAGVTVDGRILIVLKKINGEWKIAAHETVVRDQPL